MTIFERLEKDHQKALNLVEQLESSGSARERERIFARLKQELEMHAMFEEDVFYPAVAEAGGVAKDEVAHAVEDHDDMTSVLENMNEAEKDSEDFDDLLDQLGVLIREHVEEEEATIFELALEVIDEARATELAEQYRAARQEFLKAA